MGYAQGMNDLLARFLVVTDSEVDSYWMFTHYMRDKRIEGSMMRKVGEWRYTHTCTHTHTHVSCSEETVVVIGVRGYGGAEGEGGGEGDLESVVSMTVM